MVNQLGWNQENARPIDKKLALKSMMENRKRQPAVQKLMNCWFQAT